jgi:HAD superfamily hydrolase (TIGR01549 family)
MKYKGILLDLDNTLYKYDKPHLTALDEVFRVCSKKFSISQNESKKAYGIARKKVHIELSETAASHNRLLYFQKMMEILKINPLCNGLKLYNTYWNTFLDNLKVCDGVYEFLEKYKGKVCLVTDLTAHIQFRKIEKLRFGDYIDCIVTSEEAGREKPHPYIFTLALQKLNLMPEDVCMIGDSFNKDITGASNLSIHSFWINHEEKNVHFDEKLVTNVKSFNEILKLV